MGLSDGGKSSTLFDIPAACESAGGTLEVIANGIASKPVAVTLQ